MSVCRTIGDGAGRIAVVAAQPAEAWQLWLASRLARAGWQVDLIESGAAARSDWQRGETARAAAQLDAWFDRAALEAELRSGATANTPYEFLVLAGIEEGLRSSMPAAKLGEVAIELVAHPLLTRVFAVVRSTASASVIRPQVAPGDDFDSVWMRLLVETATKTSEVVQRLAAGETVAPSDTVPKREEIGPAETTEFQRSRRGIWSSEVLATGFRA